MSAAFAFHCACTSPAAVKRSWHAPFAPSLTLHTPTFRPRGRSGVGVHP